MNRYNEAIAHAQKAIEIDPSKYDPYFHAGVVYFAMKDYEKTISNLESATIHEISNPLDKALIYYFLGHSYGYLKNLRKSKENYEIALPLLTKIGDKEKVSKVEKQLKDLEEIQRVAPNYFK